MAAADENLQHAEVEQNATPEAEPVKRGRGRPKGSTNKTDAEKLLTEPVTEGAEKPAAKKPGRPPSKTTKKKQEEIAGLAKNLMGIHAIASMATGIPEVAIAAEEAEALAKGVTAVCDEYGLNIDGKTGAALQLFGAAAMIYGPRFMAVQVRLAKERREREQAEVPENHQFMGPMQQ